MEFGKLANIRGVDFALGPEDPRTVEALGGLPRSNPSVRVGLPIWAEKNWVGTLYPKGAPSRDFLPRYAEKLGTVELNATHYAIPGIETVKRWSESVRPDFRFSPKVLQSISHQLGHRASDELIEPFCESMRAFGDRLGVSFLQLPPDVGPEGLPVLVRALDRMKARGLGNLAVEFRHPKWFEARRLIAPAFEALRSRGVSTVITDVAGRRDVSHATLTTRQAVIRFVGCYDETSDLARADAWAERVALWLGQGLEDAYFLVHQPDYAGMPELARDFIAGLARARRGPPLLPELDLTGGEKQMSLF